MSVLLSIVRIPPITLLGDFVISWNIANNSEANDGWYFPNFEIQEYLLQLLNVGGPKFDEYGRTVYGKEDCMRLRNAISHMRETMNITRKEKIRYETIHEGLVELDKNEIIRTLKFLDSAAEITLNENSSLVFYGD